MTVGYLRTDTTVSSLGSDSKGPFIRAGSYRNYNLDFCSVISFVNHLSVITPCIT